MPTVSDAPTPADPTLDGGAVPAASAPAPAGPAPLDAEAPTLEAAAGSSPLDDDGAMPVSAADPVPLAGPADSGAVQAPAPLSPAECAARLAALFPALFGQSQPLPLKLRIQADVQQRAPGVFSRKSLSAFLQRYTTGTAYLKALVAQGTRFDLDGLAAGEVADEHRDAALAELARRRALHEQRRAAERQVQRAAQDEARRAWQADQQARQGRAALLRAFETTTLTRANFCALKQIPEAQLDVQLAQARTERQQAPAPEPLDQRADRPAQRPPQRRPDNGRRPPGERSGPARRGAPRPPSPR